jgi:hypothetical protein
MPEDMATAAMDSTGEQGDVISLVDKVDAAVRQMELQPN